MSNLCRAVIFAVSLISIASLGTEEKEDPLVAEGRLATYQLREGQNTELQIEMQLPETYIAYADKFAVQILDPDGVQFSTWNVSPSFEFFDKFTKQNKKGVKAKSSLKMPLELPAKISVGNHTMQVQLTYQACTPTYCLFPKKKLVKVPFEILSPHETAEKPQDGYFWQRSFKDLQQENFWLALLFVFVAGFLTSLTPCIFPMIPITIAILTKGSEGRSRFGHFTISFSYVLGIATTYAVVGVVAALTGSLFGAALSQPWVLAALSLLFLALSLSMFGLFELQAPMGIRDWFGNARFLNGHLGAYLTGLGAGIVASPCVGPVLVAILTFVAETQSVLLGFVYLFVFAIGMGQLFLFLGMSSQYRKYLPKSGEWMVGIKDLLGFLMFACAFWYAKPLFQPGLWQGLLGLGLVILASLNGIFLPIAKENAWLQLRKGLMILIFILGSTFVVHSTWDFLQPEAANTVNTPTPEKELWAPITPDGLKKARASGKPVIVDFFAEWCAACKELEADTFSKPDVTQELSGFQTYRFDATFETPAMAEFKSEFKIFGLPSILFFNSKGEWLKDLTLTGFERPPEFIQRLKKAKEL